MKTLFKQPFPMFVATIVTAVALGACSNEMNLTDVSTGEPQTVAVNFTTSSIGSAAAETPWQENDRVTVIPWNNSDDAITFGYTKQADESYAWQNIVAGGDNYYKAILPCNFSAYFPTTEGTSFEAFTLPNISDDGQTEQADQSSAALLHAADYMTAPTTTVASGQGVLNLTLAHRLCRLTFIVTEYGNEFNGLKPELTEVKIKSQKRGVRLADWGDGVVVAPVGNPVWVSPLTDANASDQSTYTAIVTPCTLTSGETELMSLTVNGTPLRVKYKGNIAKLVSGSAYTFHLKVGKDYVTVMGSDIVEWEGTETPVTSKGVVYFTATDLKVGDYYYSDGATSDGGLRKQYTDGTFMMDNVAPESDKTVIGIVYWVGDATAKDRTLKKDHPKCTNGLVVALSGDVEVSWQRTVSVQDWLNSNRFDEFQSVQTDPGVSDPLNNIQGYNNTKAIEAFNDAPTNSLKGVIAVKKAVNYRSTVPAPGSSSDWYLPSAKELTLLCGKDIKNIWADSDPAGIDKRDLINGQLELIGGTALSSTGWYWPSSESTYTSSYCVDFSNGCTYTDHKVSDHRVRFSLAF